MKIYSYIKDFLAYSFMGFILVPVRMVCSLLSGQANQALQDIAHTMQHGGNASTMLKVIFWIIVMVYSFYVFTCCAPIILQELQVLQKIYQQG